MNKLLLALATVSMAITSITAPATSWAEGPAKAPAKAPDEEIRALETAFNAAYERNDLDAYFAYYADDASFLFDSGKVTLAAYRQEWYQLIAAGGGVEKNTISDMVVKMGPGDTSAVVTYLLEVNTRQADGKVSKDHAHETDAWFKRDGKWLIVHVHYTVEAPPAAKQ